MSTYDLTQTIPTEVITGDILNCPYSGAGISITLPPGRYKLEVWGAQGGSYGTTSTGGKGGYSVGTVTLNEEATLHLYAGGAGTYSTTSASFVSGGFNGGGKGWLLVRRLRRRWIRHPPWHGFPLFQDHRGRRRRRRLGVQQL